MAKIVKIIFGSVFILIGIAMAGFILGIPNWAVSENVYFPSDGDELTLNTGLFAYYFGNDGIRTTNTTRYNSDDALLFLICGYNCNKVI